MSAREVTLFIGHLQPGDVILQDHGQDLALRTVRVRREVPEVEPGTVGTATVSGKRGVRVMRVQPDDRAERVYVWISDHTVGGMFAHADEDVTDFQADTTAEEWQKRLDSSVTYVADKWKAEIVRLEQERAAVDVDDLIAQAREAYDAAASHAPITVGLAAAVRRVLALVAADEQAAEGPFIARRRDLPDAARADGEGAEPWPFAPGDVVRDSGEGDDAAWLDAAPDGTVVRDEEGDDWTRTEEAWVWSPGNGPAVLTRDSAHLAEKYAPLTVVSVGGAS